MVEPVDEDDVAPPKGMSGPEFFGWVVTFCVLIFYFWCVLRRAP